MWESVGEADLLPDNFDCKQSRKSVDLLRNCHPSPSRITFAFRSSEVRCLLFDLDPFGSTELLECFTFFLRECFLFLT